MTTFFVHLSLPFKTFFKQHREGSGKNQTSFRTLCRRPSPHIQITDIYARTTTTTLQMQQNFKNFKYPLYFLPITSLSSYSTLLLLSSATFFASLLLSFFNFSNFSHYICENVGMFADIFYFYRKISKFFLRN